MGSSTDPPEPRPDLPAPPWPAGGFSSAGSGFSGAWDRGAPYAAEPLPEPGPLHSRRHIVLAVGLFVLTVVSTIVSPMGGPLYALAIMTILLSHEMGHYIMCRRYHVRSTLPLFMPMPFISPFGTMGAVIFMRQIGRNRKVLFDIGIAGPLAGLVPSIVATIWGVAHSRIVAVPFARAAGVQLGDSLLFAWLGKILHPGMPKDAELLLNPVAYAGWAGFFVTALNLLPIGQLDGGHVVYGILGRKSIWFSWAALGAFAVVACFYPQWWVLIALILVMGGPRHRPALDEDEPLGGRRVALGLFALAVFVLSFTPRPFQIH